MKHVIRPPAAMGLKEKIGQMLVVGFPGGEHGLEQLHEAVSGFAAGNVILFSRNVAGGAAETYALTAAIRRIVLACCGSLPLIAIDQEGGVVARLRNGVTPMPGAMAQAAAVAGGRRSAADIRALGKVCGAELRALGVNWNLAPVADVNVNPANPVIGVRSYGEDPKLVAELASAFAAGLAEAGVLATAKHFPGHGDTTVDSHLGLPLVEHDLPRLESVELLPFKRLIAEGVSAIMTAHIRFPAIEPRALPATLSPAVLKGLLRERLGFHGLVVTDCLEMRAITEGFPDAAVMAVEAGADVLFISHTLATQRAAAEALMAAVESGRMPESRIDESVARIAAAKARMLPAPETWDEAQLLIARPESLALSAGISACSLTLLRRGQGLKASPGSVYVDVVPRNASRVEDQASGSGLVAEALASLFPGRMRLLSLPEDPGEEAIARTLAAATGHDVVVGIHNASVHPAQVELVRALACGAGASGPRIGIVSMRSPYDVALFSDLLARTEAGFLCAYEYTEASARCVAQYLAGAAEAPGRHPARMATS